ncbi:sulfatase-like hydrolase/transferase [Rhodopirellula sallentina]|nr:sulfatase-like hydrolase/transferase [Rhodopirellula sallentina]
MVRPVASLLLALSVCLVAVAQQPIGSGRHATGERPNIVVILADDMGFADTGFTGSTDIETPHLNALAASGVTFTSGYVTHPYCGPSRAGLLAGRYQHRFGFETNPAYDPSNPYMGIDVNETLFPERLRRAGYRTGMVGKWHLGAAAPFHPNKRGFDYFYGFLGGGHDYFRIDLRQPVKEGYTEALERNGLPAVFDGYLTTALSRDAADFVDRNAEKPFFLYVAYNAPHAPLQAPDELLQKYSHIEDTKRRRYAAMVDAMDAGIGMIMESLQRNDVRDNTLVFFLSDNGGPQASPNKPSSWNGSSNGEFRGGKGNLYDGGVHVPFVASWPNHFPHGAVCDRPVISLDIAATAVALATGSEELPRKLEGVNLVPIVKQPEAGPKSRYLYWRESGVRWSILDDKRNKHVLDRPNRSPELFHLATDVSEQNDRVKEEPEIAEQLRNAWLEWNEANVASRLNNYKGYHKLRDQFFLDSIPAKAKKEGYSPEPIPTFPK